LTVFQAVLNYLEKPKDIFGLRKQTNANKTREFIMETRHKSDTVEDYSDEESHGDSILAKLLETGHFD
jgi:hypothetical protein